VSVHSRRVKCLDVCQVSWSERDWQQADDGQTDSGARLLWRRKRPCERQTTHKWL